MAWALVAPAGDAALGLGYTAKVKNPATRAVRVWWVAAILVGIRGVAAPGGAWGAPREAERLGAAFRAYDAGQVREAASVARRLDVKALRNADYVWWLRGQAALLLGEGADACQAFTALATFPKSRYAPSVPWKLADCAWASGDFVEATRRYEALLAKPGGDEVADLAVILHRLSEGYRRRGDATLATQYEKRLLMAYPGHELAQRLARLRAPTFTADERIERAQRLTATRWWELAVAELELLDVTQLDTATKLRRDYWLGTTLYKMRRRYGEAGELLLRVAPHMGGNAAEAMFHGARALSRADRDDEAIREYLALVGKHPKTVWAQEAQFLAGWLEFNRGHYDAAIPHLEQVLTRYGASKWVDDALWFIGFAHFMNKNYPVARLRLAELARRGGALEGGKGAYWLARLDELLAHRAEASQGYLALIGRYPFSWYAMLARARLAARGQVTTPFGLGIPAARGPALATTIPARVTSDTLIARADELIAAGLTNEAGQELYREEKAFLARHPKPEAMALLLARYAQAGNFNRPWMLAVVHGGSALSSPPTGDAKAWWEHAYPKAYRALIETHQGLGQNPDYYLYSIMRKESGFNPHDISYADAQGLLQMIPATTKRAAQALKLPYADGRLYEPEFNIQTGSWYIGNMLSKFKRQIPIGAGSFNSGPRPVMKWLSQRGTLEMDEFVELVPYVQTREYMKKVTENYARYIYLYAGQDYAQPLTVDPKFVENELTY